MKRFGRSEPQRNHITQVFSALVIVSLAVACLIALVASNSGWVAIAGLSVVVFGVATLFCATTFRAPTWVFWFGFGLGAVSIAIGLFQFFVQSDLMLLIFFLSIGFGLCLGGLGNVANRFWLERDI